MILLSLRQLWLEHDIDPHGHFNNYYDFLDSTPFVELNLNIRDYWLIELYSQQYFFSSSLSKDIIFGKSPQNFCTACFDGDYPIEFSGQPGKQLAIEFEVRSL